MKSLKLACVGGGTGLSALLSGIKQFVQSEQAGAEIINMNRLSAIVTVSDDGGSTGRLIEEFDVLPPGDIRKLLVSLSEADDLVSSLFEYRFSSNGDLGGHTVGNLLLIALTELNQNSFPKAIQEASKLLAVRGQIIPASLQPTVLCAELTDGEIVRGESLIPERKNREPIRRVFLEPRGNDSGTAVTAHRGAVTAICQADAIIIGPGSLYTSIMPNLAYSEIAEAICTSTAVKIYICNVMSQPGETDNYTVTQHVQSITNQSGIEIDYVLVNDGIAPPQILKNYVQQEIIGQLARINTYAEEGMKFVEQESNKPSSQSTNFVNSMSDFTKHINQLSNEINRITDSSKVQIFFDPQVDQLDGIEVVTADMIHNTKVVAHGIELDVVRHDPRQLAQTLTKVLCSHFNQ